MAESWYAVVVGGVVECVERRFEVACARAKVARHSGSQVVVRRATPDEVSRFSAAGPGEAPPWASDEDPDGDIPF